MCTYGDKGHRINPRLFLKTNVISPTSLGGEQNDCTPSLENSLGNLVGTMKISPESFNAEILSSLSRVMALSAVSWGAWCHSYIAPGHSHPISGCLAQVVAPLFSIAFPC